MKNKRRELRIDGRAWNELRPVRIQRGFTGHAEGSAFIEIGKTRVLCTASVEPKVPDFLEGSGKGWITAEYSMLPRSTVTRTSRGPSARSYEIQRLIGRALRSVTDLSRLGSRTIRIDCDVIEADGSTRTSAITGSFIALYDALNKLIVSNEVASMPIIQFVAATSVGIVNGHSVLDLCYEEDSRADVDLNIVMTEDGQLVEIQGTAERPFERLLLDELLDLAREGIQQLVTWQRKTLLIDSD
ncbi:MAG: ribonuclease PH [Candidatus Abyssobacteria bacterium SURF_5]|uniref:Ribonuclease PH n=1 Tax=Abyssobacteria bacterium (strain SURF_5) TaxID=2093360 RepID=A0A3A4P041_ABYX5|nr:MAG: ribonuclease PH [Candidatus Abyssubacteria bacterium SURF_5]